MGWVEVMCTSPPHAAGVVTVEVSAMDGGFSTSKVEFEYQAAAVVLSVQPGSGPSAGVGVVKVGGEHLIGADALCGFGSSDPVHAEMVSSALVKCEAPAHGTGVVALELSTSDEGQLFSRSSMVYEYTDEAVVVGLEPHEGPQGGGTLVRLALISVDAGVVSTCRFGTIGPLAGHRGRGGAECATPAHEGGLVGVAASSNNEVWGASEVAFEYRSSAVVFAVAPEAGPVGGGTLVRVMGSGLRGESVQCRFGLEVVDGQFIGGDEMCLTQARASTALFSGFYGLTSLDALGDQPSMYGLSPIPRAMGSSTWQREEQCMGWVEVMCTSPPHAAGVVTVEVSAMDGGFSSSKVHFEYQAAAVVLSVQPGSGPSAGVGVVKVGGEHLIGTGALCGFGSSDPVHAEMVSSVLVKCEAPAHGTGVVAVEMSTIDGNHDHSSNYITYSYEGDAFLVAINPFEGYGTGGVSVELTFNSPPSKHISCSFGSIFPISGRVSQSSMSCVSPSMTPLGGSVQLGSSYTQSLVAASEPLRFSFVPSPEAESADPLATPFFGGTTITVVAGPLLQGASVVCRFGTIIVRATRAAIMLRNGPGPPSIASSRVPEPFYGLDSVYGLMLSSASTGSSPSHHDNDNDSDFFEDDNFYGFYGLRSGRSERQKLPVLPTIVTCEAPPQAAGFTSLDVGVDTGNGAEFNFPPQRTAIDFEYEVPASASHAMPPTGFSTGGTLVRVAGQHFSALSRPCSFGNAVPSATTFVSSVLVMCESPPHDEGVVSLEISLDDTGELWTRNAVQFAYVEQGSVVAVDPPHVIESGGNMLKVYGASFLAEGINACAFGTIAPLPSRASTSDRLECVSPAAASGAREVSGASLDNAQDKTAAAATVIVFPTPGAGFAYPARGPSSGSTPVTVIGHGLGVLGQEGVNGMCAFGEVTTPTTWVGGTEDRVMETWRQHRSSLIDDLTGGGFYGIVDENTGQWRTLGSAMGWSAVSCSTPPTPPGVVSLDIHVAPGADVSGISFTFAPRATIMVLHPATVPDEMGTVIRAMGTDLPEDLGPAETGILSCAFGSITATTRAIFVSSAMVMCETSGSLLPGLLQMQIVDEYGQHWAQDSSAVLEVLTSIRAVAVEPSSGWEEGGLALEIHVGTLPFSIAENSLYPPFGCQFGTITPVLARAASTSMLCVTPAASPGQRQVGVTPGLNLGNGAAGGGPAFHFLALPKVMGVDVEHASSAGGTSITFHGLTPLPMGHVACSVDGMVREARGVSPTELQCVLPPHYPGFVQVSIVHSSAADGIGHRALAIQAGSGLSGYGGSYEVEYFAPFSLVSHYPRRSPTIGGTIIELYGEGFMRGRHRCYFGSLSEPVHVISSTVGKCAVTPRRFMGDISFTMSARQGTLNPKPYSLTLNPKLQTLPLVHFSA